jgi:competence protein ComEC
MGAVALVGLGAGGRRLGIRALSASVVLLLAVSPALASSAGFALSVLATGGILLAAPPLRRSLGEHLPGPVADAVAVPVAAQLACTPLVAVISAQVSLVAVAANLAAAPFVGPTTVLGLVGGLLATVWTPLGRPAGWVASWCAQAIVEVAEVSSGLPGAALDWGTGPVALVLLTALCAALLVLLPQVLRRRRVAVAVAAVLVVAVLQPLPAGAGRLGRVLPGPDWPPAGWVMVACVVGQGDALVLHAGPRSAVVVDAGPEPRLVDRCLGRLGVQRVPAVVLTHFHADHVDGLEGVLRGREVGEIQVTGFAEPAYGASYVSRLAAGRGIPVRVPAYDEVARVGSLTWQVVAPQHLVDDNPNDASVVLLVVTRGLRLLLAGDVEPPSQAPLTRLAGLAPVDVLKVPHHGSAHQDDRLLQGLGASLALVSVGKDNDYGHPSPRTLAVLRAAGAQVHRTDLEGDLAVVAGPDGPRVVSRG